jgi:hypothetical protein
MERVSHLWVLFNILGVRYSQLFFLLYFTGVGLSPLGTAATTGLLHQPQMIYYGDYEAVGGVKICRGNRSTRRKPAPATICPPQIPHDLTRARIRASAVGSQRLSYGTSQIRSNIVASHRLGEMKSSARGNHVPFSFVTNKSYIRARQKEQHFISLSLFCSAPALDTVTMLVRKSRA